MSKYHLLAFVAFAANEGIVLADRNPQEPHDLDEISDQRLVDLINSFEATPLAATDK